MEYVLICRGNLLVSHKSSNEAPENEPNYICDQDDKTCVAQAAYQVELTEKGTIKPTLHEVIMSLLHGARNSYFNIEPTFEVLFLVCK